MKILIAEEYGFCNGVKRALNRLDKALRENPDTQIYSVGEIIHNQDVVDRYKAKGVTTVQSVWEVPPASVGVVRAHGLPDSVIEEAKEKGLNIIDATCPWVRHISDIIQKEKDSTAAIFLIGEIGHPEVIAATADFGQRVQVLDHKAPLPKDLPTASTPVILLSQTTMAEETFEAFVAQFISRFQKVTVYNTICQSTRVRQRSAVETAKKVQTMIIIGGPHSSNARRLADLCAKETKTFFVERAAQLNAKDFTGIELVGISAGASTPDDLVAEVVAFLQAMNHS